METIDIKTLLFRVGKTRILLSGSAGKETATAAPMAFGYSASHSGTSPAKYNATAKVLDFILVNKIVKALEGNEQVYVEVSKDGKTYKALTDGVTTFYEGDAMKSFEQFVPLVMYHLREASTNTELKECFAKIKDSYSKTGSAELVDLVRFCDCFYYSIAFANPEHNIEENSLQIPTIRAAIRSGELKQFKTPLEGLEPSIWAEADATVETSAFSAGTHAEDAFESIKRGEKRISYKWKDEQKTRIPTLESLNDFVPVPTYHAILNKILVRMNKVNLRLDAGLSGVEAIGKDYVNLMMVGKPGTGKTTLAYALGAATGMPTYTVALNKDSESDVFQGMTKVVDGQLQFCPTDFLDAYTNGGIIILEEINLANPNVVMGTIGQSIEYPFVLMENGYKPIKRHPLCVIIGTMNVGTYGSAGLNEALSSRFKTTYVLNDPEDEDFLRILQKAGGTKKASKWVLNIYKKIVAYLISPEANAEDISMRLTMRGCIGALEGIEEGENPKQAINRSLIGKIAECDLALADKVWQTIQSLPDLG